MNNTRRHFTYLFSLGLFAASESLGLTALDRLAAATMRTAGNEGEGDGLPPKPETSPESASPDDATDTAATPDESDSDAADAPEEVIHWSRDENSNWQWYVRENWRDDKWVVTGITTPISKHTGEPLAGAEGYLADALVPDEFRSRADWRDASPETFQADGDEEGEPNSERRSRHGRPPSEWLRSLQANELRRWLRSISVPEAGVSGMSFWTHLTRDHSFRPSVVDKLTKDEQAKLHSAAHYGY